MIFLNANASSHAFHFDFGFLKCFNTINDIMEIAAITATLDRTVTASLTFVKFK